MNTWIRNNRGLLPILLLFGLFRTAVADWNPIPSGSMRPTILEGDMVSGQSPGLQPGKCP